MMEEDLSLGSLLSSTATNDDFSHGSGGDEMELGVENISRPTLPPATTRPSRLTRHDGPNNTMALLRRLYEKHFQLVLQPKDILSNLREGNHITEEDARRINEIENREDSVSHLLRCLEASREPGCLQALYEALEEKGYQTLVDLIDCKERKSYKYYDKLMELYHRDLEQIDVLVILDLLEDLGCLNKYDVEKIEIIHSRDGKARAMIQLLLTLPMRKAIWSQDFIKILDKQRYRPVIEKIFEVNPEKLLDPVFAEEFFKAQEIDITEETGSVDGQSLEFHGEACEVNYSRATLLQDNVNINETNPKSYYSESDTGLPLLPQRGASNSQGAVIDIELSPPEKKDFQLYPDQLEISKHACNGKNCLISAVTNYGKTFVALHISQSHLDQDPVNRRIAFLVEKVQLAEQQFQRYQIHLRSEYKVFRLCGDINEKKSLSQLAEEYHVILMTPQMMVDALDDVKDCDNNTEKTSIDRFTMLIFDECHHTTKSHPFNLIMKNYLREKFKNRQREFDKRIKLPQVVGLTASLGTGKTDKVESAKEHIIKILANLDSQYICTIDERFEADVRKRVPKAKTELLNVQRRDCDPFHDTIQDVMEKIESSMLDTIKKNCGAKMSKDVEKICKRLTGSNIPDFRDGDVYTQWVNELEKGVQKIYEADLRLLLIPAVRYLKDYHSSLVINLTCRTKDALGFLKSHLETIEEEEGSETQLMTQAKELLNDLKHCEYNEDDQNPLLTNLRDILLDGYNKDRVNYKGLVFVKTRNMTDYLRSWAEEDPKLKELKPNIAVGTANSSKTGMTRSKLQNIIEDFRNGDHKVIFATWVVGEGIDVPECITVVRYDCATNEIAMTQSRGRARAPNSKYSSMGVDDRGSVKKERINLEREQIALEAVKQLNQMRPEEFLNEIRKKQDSIDLGFLMKTALPPTHGLVSGQIYTIRCYKCDAYICESSDFRKVATTNYTVFSEDDLMKFEIREVPPRTHGRDLVKRGTVHCNRCHCHIGALNCHKEVPFPFIRIASLMIEDEQGHRVNVKKWKKAPFLVEHLSKADFQKKKNSPQTEKLMRRLRRLELGNNDEMDTN